MNVSEKHPFVSVVMPTYNVGKYIEEAVQSILNQTFLDFEFIIVDDGSSDDTGAIADAYAEKYPSIVRAIHQFPILASGCYSMKRMKESKMSLLNESGSVMRLIILGNDTLFSIKNRYKLNLLLCDM